MEKEGGLVAPNPAKTVPSPPPLPSATPEARKPAVVRSVTRDEIDKYWRTRRMIEEDHLLAAEKAAARIRAKALKEEDYRRFEESLKEMLNSADGDEDGKEGDDEELQIGIKDWWTKSKFAYLNQPAIKSMGENATPKRPTSTYIPQHICFRNVSPAPQLYNSSSFGVF
ncbi:hypothetical protein MUK42_20213 [Musa troglodytarum]|uniref:Uncharacterized protein n=3 Tax=Musa troglodytarum TaxID=320322 RepID=A0A9E7FZY9_9LILI|nr:hypothetical protein MUK42_20213 [Musa troglodytarum]URE03009.1 hypothetical protein MUK42_20213 [Musa troglodytarum]